ncbi:MAG: TetR/AcrR family transcriptional regulator [Alphaproteobacteria bacterium]|nr:TetR/AcrR family transcriptional regulator [Alphaproteobacteria bacterium]
MAIIRLDNEERRKAIVDAAMPLFARRGFAGTTTKEIAEAARVSEALVFKHFPSKAALYEEILRLGCLGDPALECLNQLPASTASLVQMMGFMLRHFLLTDEMDTRHRLMVNSFLEDGEYCQLVFHSVLTRVYPKFAECLAAARAAGDLAHPAAPPENLFWFAQHVAAMLAYARLPRGGTVPYRGDTDTVIAEAAGFILRGLGLTPEAIARHGAGSASGDSWKIDDREASRA